MINVLDAVDKILRGNYSFNNCYSFFILKNRYARSG